MRTGSHIKISVLQINDRQFFFTVHLDARTCACTRFQDTDIPCGHAVAVINCLKKPPLDYMPRFVHAHSWLRTYSADMAI
jgi:hypothetical protein